jgi:hypothetical protein
MCITRFLRMRLFTKARKRTMASCKGRVVKISDNEYHVKNYTVYYSSRKHEWICECMHYSLHHTQCAHITYLLLKVLARPSVMITAKADSSPSVMIKVHDVADRSNEVMFREADYTDWVGTMVATMMLMS